MSRRGSRCPGHLTPASPVLLPYNPHLELPLAAPHGGLLIWELGSAGRLPGHEDASRGKAWGTFKGKKTRDRDRDIHMTLYSHPLRSELLLSHLPDEDIEIFEGVKKIAHGS